MPTWTETLDPDLRDRVGQLNSRSCQFIWRNRESGETSADPIEGELCWWEAWHAESLLTFSGPYQGPISGETLSAMMRMFLPNIEVVVGVKKSKT